MSEPVSIERLPAADVPSAIPGLARVLHACVLDGASIGFVWPFTEEEAEGYWRELLPDVNRGRREVLVARHAGSIAGSVQLVLEPRANGHHRAEVSKLIVHPEARRLGLARRLMQALEALARQRSRSLLLLDTNTDSPAELLYLSLGYQRLGVVPDYARSVHGELAPATYMYKQLAPQGV
jgi:ribosomal protein S18 acetylase RimI-like enzyme